MTIKNFIYLHKGKNNNYYNEIAQACKKIESLSCELRNELEELASLMNKASDKEEACLFDEDENEYTCQDIQDFANNVSEIEELFFMDED